MTAPSDPLSAELRALIDVVPDATLVVDEDGHIVHANSQLVPLFGYRLDELYGEPVEKLMPDRLRHSHAEHRAGFHADPHTRPMGQGRDLVGRRRDGSEIPIEISLSPLHTDSGTYVLSAIRDATDRRQTERTLRDNEVRLAEAQRIGRFGSWEWRIEQNEVLWSDELYRIFGLEPRSGASFEGYVAAIAPEERDLVVATIENALETATSYSIDHVIVRPDSSRAALRCRGECIVEGGRVVRMVGIAQDVSEVRRAESELERVTRQKAAILEAAGEGVIGLDEAGRVTFVNPAAARMLRASASALMGQVLAGIIYCQAPAPPRALVEPGSGEDVFCGVDGNRFPVEYVVSPLRDGEREIGRVVTFNDITERRRTEAQLQYLADHDALTGLFNRRRFEEELEREIARTARSGGVASVLMLDLDNFKDVNDSLGHSAGDSLVRAVAGAVQTRLRSTDVVARIGGDELAALLPDTTPDQATAVARSLLDTVRRESVFVQERRARISTSIGVTSFDGDGTTAEEVMVAADVAMYEAKDAGRDRFVVYEPCSVRHAEIGTRMTVLERLRTALDDDDGLVLYGQPILDLSSNRVTQFEVLVRMRGDDGELIPPGAFIPSAERFGLISAVDRWVLRHSIRAFAAADPKLRPERMEVNVSGRSIGDPELRAVLEREIEGAGIEPRSLILELTETAAVADLERVADFAESLRELGCGFALDDFGAGFGSFAYLKLLPFDHLKIDGEFITSLAVNRTDQLLVKAVVDIARGMEKRTIAESVEDGETLELLRGYGVDLAQGFHVGRPVPIEQVLGAPSGLAARPAPAAA